MTTYFVGNHYELTNGIVTKYYFAGTQRIAMRKGTTLTYMLSDHPSITSGHRLGSTSLITNATGGVISETRYTAWGEVRYQGGVTPTNYSFTGQASYVTDFGLLFYNSRFYDPALGRFSSPDTIIPGEYISQSWDRYAYVGNNPVKNTDPDGHCYPLCTALGGAVVGAIFGIAVVVANQFIHPELHLTTLDFGKAALVGATAGALIGTGAGAGVGAAMAATLIGAGTGAAGSAIAYTAAAGADYNSDEMIVNAGIGLVTGATTGSISSLTTSRPVIGFLLKSGVSFAGGESQMIASNKFDGEGSPPYEIFGGGLIGVLGTIASESVSGVPVLGRTTAPFVDDAIRSGIIEYFGNRVQDKIDQDYDAYH